MCSPGRTLAPRPGLGPAGRRPRPGHTPARIRRVPGPEPPEDHLYHALGVCLGRFGPNREGILDPTTDDLSHALPGGILFLSDASGEDSLTPSPGLPEAEQQVPRLARRAGRLHRARRAVRREGPAQALGQGPRARAGRPLRPDKKCQEDPSLAVAHGCFWKYHPRKAYRWELRLQDEIGPEFTLDEPGSDAARARLERDEPELVQELRNNEWKCRMKKAKKEKKAGREYVLRPVPGVAAEGAQELFE